MLSLQASLEKLREKNFPYWKLKVKPSAKLYDSFDSDDIDGSLDALEKAVASYNNPQAVFEIEARAKATSSSDGIKAWNFTVSGEYPRAGTQGLSGVGGGLGAVDMFNMLGKLNDTHETRLSDIDRRKERLEDDRRAFSEEKFKWELKKITEESDLNRREKELKSKEEDLKKKEKEVNELCEKRAKQGEVVLGKIIGNKLNEWFPADAKGLAGAEGEVKETTPELTEAEKMIESIAQNINEKVKEPEKIKNIGIAVQVIIKHPESFKYFVEYEKEQRAEA